MKTPSLKTIKSKLDIQDSKAKRIKRIMIACSGNNPKQTSRGIELINKVLNCYGVETIFGRWNKGWNSSYYCDIQAEFCNNGDSYLDTVIFDAETERFQIQSTGTWTERHSSRLNQ